MKVFDLFSKRQEQLRGEVPDVYTYDHIPSQLRVQIIHIWLDALGRSSVYLSTADEAYRFINDALCREYGLFQLSEPPPVMRHVYTEEIIANFFLQCQSNERVLDVIELVFQVINFEGNDPGYRHRAGASLTAEDAIKELNLRFREHGIGYRFEISDDRGQLVRIDNEILHAEVVIPALQLLRENIYRGANEEFLKAHEHYRHGRYKECINECLKAFESSMKAICTKRKWTYDSNDTASKLIKTCLENGLVPSYLQSQYSSLSLVLTSGVPTLRNKLSSHGQGIQETKVPEHFASYVLHLTATNILFLIQSEKNLL